MSKAKGNKDRRQGRTLALQRLYAWDQKGCDDDGLLAPTDEDGNAEARAFAVTLVEGLARELPAVDAVLDGCLRNWSLPRLAVTDRCLLRLGCYELLYCADTPPRVAINEYIELSKVYGSEDKSAKLANGVLDRIAREHRGAEMQARR